MRHADCTPIAELSDKQREVLELVIDRKSSKEIARILGISKHTVDQRIMLARQKYGAADRNDLVHRYIATRGVYDRIAYDLAQLPLTTSPSESVDQGRQSGPVYSVSDVECFFSPHTPSEYPPLSRPLETLDRRFGVFGRLCAIGLLAALIAVSLLAMLTMAETLTQLR
jgi:DNA-binding CsgD family transcriptional regulator